MSSDDSTDRKAILLILDLDETLIYATEQPLDRTADCIVGPYCVYFRPHLHAFLTDVAPLFQLAVWSSGSPDYVAVTASRIMPNGVEPALVWGRDRCTRRYDHERQEEYWVKDLKKVKRLGFDLDRVLIVEDTPQKVERNYGNAIYVASYFGEADDEELLGLTAYLKSIHADDNVRRVEKRGWKRKQHPPN